MLNIDDTRTLLGVVERSFKPTTTLIDTFFPEEKTFITEYVEMEYRKGARRMAPFVVPGTKGVNLARTGTKVRTYKAPLMKPKRVIEASDIIALRQNVPRNCALKIWPSLLKAVYEDRNGWPHRY